MSNYAQQRSLQNIDSIANKYCRMHGSIRSMYSKIKSSSIVHDDYLISGKEAFYIFTSTSLNKGSFFIVSGDEKLPSILAYSDSGNFEDGVSPLLQNIQWGQAQPYNELCPIVYKEKTLTGCVATAMAQVMHYYQYPTVTKGNNEYNTITNNLHITHDFSKNYFD